MSDSNTAAVETTNSVAEKTKAKKSAKPTKAKKDTAPKTDSKRVRLFKLLAKYPNGLNNADIREKMETDAIAAMCRDEAVFGRLKVLIPEEGKHGKRFVLSAKGKQALEKGTVDSNAAPKGEWKD